MKKTIRGIISIPLCIITYPIFVVTSSLFGLGILLGLVALLPYPMYWLGNDKEAMENTLYHADMIYLPFLVGFKFWYKYYKEGTLKLE